MNKTKFGLKDARKFFRRALVIARAEWDTFVAVVAGSAIYVVGVMVFTVPFRFPDSGVTGIAVLVNYSMGMSIALIVGCTNVALLAWAWRELSPRLTLWTIFGVILTTLLMELSVDIPYPQTDQKLLIAVIGGAIKGFGGGLVLRKGASLGGLDIVVLYLQKKYGIEVGKYNFYINLAILGIASFIVGIENAMLGLVGVYASSVAIDNVISSFDRRRHVFVITKDLQPVVRFITHELGRGSTIIEAQGGYSGEERPILMCLLTRRQSVDLKRFLAENQPRAFMVVSEASEVLGKGFKTWR